MTDLTTRKLLGALLVVALLAPCRTLLAKSRLSDFKSDENKLTLKPGEKAHFAFRMIIYEGQRTQDQFEQALKKYAR